VKAWLRNIWNAQRNAVALEEYQYLLRATLRYVTHDGAIDPDRCDDTMMYRAVDAYLADRVQDGIAEAVNDGELRRCE
jgi:hypothetical protein